MPYNTRRKSLSLPSLGIQLPNTSRAHRSNSKSSSPDQVMENHPAKRVKREHSNPSPLPSPRQSPIAEVTTQPPRRVAERTPPPSPGDVINIKKIDTEGINDDIVIAVIEQLEKTGNRPHLIKELAAVLASTNNNIANSANPAALLSSRLSLYMKRPWTALSPCPLAKELIPVHPRKVFFYLTSQPRGELPSNSDDIIAPSLAALKRLTPSISDPSVEDTDVEHMERSRMSPSPEVELFSPDLDENTPPPTTPGESFSGRNNTNPNGTPDTRHRPNRAPSPGLEADEKGFTETASAVRASRLLQNAQSSTDVQKDVFDAHAMIRQKNDHELGYDLFGRAHQGLLVPEQKGMFSSPMMQPKSTLHMDMNDIDMDMGDASWTMMSPENIDVDELDAMFTGY